MSVNQATSTRLFALTEAAEAAVKWLSVEETLR